MGIPHVIVPRDEKVQAELAERAQEWWDGLTLAERLGVHVAVTP